MVFISRKPEHQIPKGRITQFFQFQKRGKKIFNLRVKLSYLRLSVPVPYKCLRGESEIIFQEKYVLFNLKPL